MEFCRILPCRLWVPLCSPGPPRKQRDSTSTQRHDICDEHNASRVSCAQEPARQYASGYRYCLYRYVPFKIALCYVLSLRIFPSDRILDNIAVDENGALWIAGIVDTLAIMKTAMNPDVQDAPSSALRVIVKEYNGPMTEESYQVARVGQLARNGSAHRISSIYVRCSRMMVHLSLAQLL